MLRYNMDMPKIAWRQQPILCCTVGFCLLILVWSHLLFSQSYPVRTYSVDDGLASSTINSITQDLDGVMWFATARGISSYDGQSCQNYSYEHGLKHEEYFFIHVDQKNRVWACTDDLRDGLVFFDRKTQQWSVVNGPAVKTNEAIAIKATAQVETNTGLFIGFASFNAGFFLFDGQTWLKTSPGGNETKAVAPVMYSLDADHLNFYLASSEGVFVLAPTPPYQWHSLPIRGLPEPPRALAINKDTNATTPGVAFPRIWLCGETWAGYAENQQFVSLFRGSFPFFSSRVLHREILIHPNRFGGFWVANKNFLCLIDATGHLKNIRLHSASITDGAYSFFYDREYNLWTGNFRGAKKISNFCFENYTHWNGLYEDEVSAILEYRPGYFIFGHNGGFSFLIDSAIYTMEPPHIGKPFSQKGRVLDMCLDSNGDIWAAVNKRGLLRIIHPPLHIPNQDNIDISRNVTIKWYSHFSGENEIIEFTSVARHPQGDIWAIAGDKLYRWQEKGDRFIPIPTRGLPLEQCRRLFFAPDGTCYIASIHYGVLRMSATDNVVTAIDSPRSKNGNSVYAVYTYKPGIVLVGTSAGLFYIDGNHLSRCPAPFPQLSFPVYFILKDTRGFLWFGTSDGLISWNGQRMRRYRTVDGLVGREANRAAGLVDSRGRIWSGMDMGASCYYYQQELPSRPAPLTQLLYLDVSGTHYPLNQDISLAASRNDLIFYFKGISYVNEPSLTYLVRLEGYDKNWVSQFQSIGNQIRYTNLAPGQYRFHMQAINLDGVASPTLSSGLIIIQKPFFQTIWFYGLLSLALSTLVLLLQYTISRKQRATQLEKQVKLRTHELEESQEELRNIFDYAHDALFIFDPLTEIIFDANQRACDLYGFPRSEFIGMSLKDISQNVRAGEKQISETLRLGVYQNFESTQFRKDGSKMFLEINASSIKYRGKIAILSINRDVTPRKLAEMKIKNSLREKEYLLKEIHHRVKNNLQIISSLLDLHADTIEDAHINRVFMDSKNRIYSMALLHENLYRSEDLARININDYIHDIFDHFSSIFGEIMLRVNTTTDIAPIPLGMDAALPLGLILTELISNSLKYAFPGLQRDVNITTLLTRNSIY